MNGSKPSLRRWGGFALVAMVFIAAVLVGQALLFAAEALQNPGFEDGLAHWEPSGPAGNWAVVGSQTPSMYPTYTEMGDATVTPPSGEKMLRLGVPQGRDKHQARGLTTVEQHFMALDTDRLAVTFRLFSWEHREGRDAFTIDIKDSLGNSVGTLEYPVEVSLPSGKVLEAGSLPYSLSLDIGADSYLDSDWVVVRIKDIPKNELLTLSYTLNTDRDAAHDSWVYVDWWNTPPVASLQWSPESPWVGDAVQLSAALSADPDAAFDDAVAYSEWTITRVNDGATETLIGPTPVWVPTDGGDHVVRLKVMDTYGAEDTAEATVTVRKGEPKMPVAVISVLDTDPPDGQHEGDYLELVSVESYDPDFGDKITGCEWTITGPGVNDLSTDPNVYLLPPDDGIYHVGLKVTNDKGESAYTTQDISVQNTKSGVSALDIEVLPGQQPELLGRFVDCGWVDAHTAKWTFAGTDYAASVQEDNFPWLSSGAASTVGPFLNEGETLAGEFTATDDEGASTSTPVEVTAITPDPQRDEPNDTPTQAEPIPGVAAGSVHLSYIQSAGDVDFFELVMPDGTAPPYGTELLVILKDLPADYDLAVYEEMSAAEFASMPANRMPANRMPANRMPANRMPANRMPANRMPANRMPANRMDVLLAPANRMPANRMPANRMPANRMPANRMDWGWYQEGAPELTSIPLSEMSYLTGPDYQDISAGDIAFSELGLDSLVPAGTDVVAYSANRALGDEAALVEVQYMGSRMFVAVTGANGAYNDQQPYALQVEAALPYGLQELHEQTPHYPLVTAGSTNDDSVIAAPPAGDPVNTLILTAPERMQALYPGEWESLQTDLTLLAQREEVSGKIVALPSSIYDPWDTDPYSVEKANGVADDIRGYIDDYLLANPEIKYVVLVGNDRVIPQRRIKDLTLISNESYYAEDSLVALDSPLAASMFGGYDLTDDFYVDEIPSFWQGSEFFVPDRAIGRLVETPSEIKAVLDAYTLGGGAAAPATALVTGYDFFTDGANAVASTLTSAGLNPDTSLIGSNWTAQNLEDALLNPAEDLASINAHFMHFAALSAGGWTNGDYYDLMLSQDVLSIPGVLQGKFVFSMGCHSGLNVPDGDVAEFMSDLDIEPALDFAQAMAAQGASFVAPSGFGLGDTAGIGGTERLVALFAQQVAAAPDMPVGEAVAAAKRRYLSGLAQMTPYDVKSCVDWTLYGLPMYTLTTPAQVEFSEDGAGSGQFGSMGVEPSPFYDPVASSISVLDNGVTTPYSRTLTPRTASSGTYYDAGSPLDVLNIESRPLQPSFDIPLASTGGNVHGLFVTGGAFTEIVDFDPAVGTLTTGWLRDVQENDSGVDGYWPASPASYNTYEQAGTPEQSLVVLPGQFKRTSDIGASVVGVQRLYNALGVEVLRSDSTDMIPPTIASVNLYVSTSGDLTAAINMGPSPEAVRAIEILAVHNGVMTGNHWVPVSGGEDAATHVVPVTNLPEGATAEDVSLVIQVADMAGNVAVSTGKGAALRLVSVSAGGNQTYAPGSTVLFNAEIADWANLAKPVTYEWDFGDGSSAVGVLTDDAFVGDDGQALLQMEHTYLTDTSVTATLKVTEAYGGVGIDQAMLVPLPPPPTQFFVSTLGDDLGEGSETSPWRTIQHAIDMAPDGTIATINVAAGTYSEYVRIWKQDLRLIGAGAESTTITGIMDGVNPVVEVEYGTNDVQVSGFTITGGRNLAGAGVFLDQTSSATFSDCRILDNQTYGTGQGGAGIWAYTASLTLQRCVVSGNHSATDGGGILAFSLVPNTLRIIESTVTANQSFGSGAGIYSYNVPVMIERSTIDSNQAIAEVSTVYGGGIHIQGQSSASPAGLVMRDCSVANNISAHYGGGISAGWYTQMTITRSTIYGNQAQSGGGLHTLYATGSVTNNVFAGNQCSYSGAGVYNFSGAPENTYDFVNNTVVNNTSALGTDGAGLFSLDAVLNVFNCIFDGNTASDVFDDLGGAARAAYTYLRDGLEENNNGCLTGEWDGDPGFVDAAGGDYKLRPDSVCIDRGIDSWNSATAPTVDLHGVPRPAGGGFDMGAYELP